LIYLIGSFENGTSCHPVRSMEKHKVLINIIFSFHLNENIISFGKARIYMNWI